MHLLFIDHAHTINQSIPCLLTTQGAINQSINQPCLLTTQGAITGGAMWEPCLYYVHIRIGPALAGEDGGWVMGGAGVPCVAPTLPPARPAVPCTMYAAHFETPPQTPAAALPATYIHRI